MGPHILQLNDCNWFCYWSGAAAAVDTRKLTYRKDDLAMRPMGALKIVGSA